MTGRILERFNLGQPKRVIPEAPQTVISGKLSLLDRLNIILPKEVAHIIFTAHYEYDGNKIKLFRDNTNFKTFYEAPKFHQMANTTEIEEIVEVWYYYEERYKTVGEAINHFKNHVDKLIISQRLKDERDERIYDDIVFESPYLDDMRKQELLKIELLGRKRKPIKGIKCPRCPSDEGWLEEAQTRSRDEGASIYYICTTCEHRWKKR